MSQTFRYRLQRRGRKPGPWSVWLPALPNGDLRLDRTLPVVKDELLIIERRETP